MPGNEVVEPSLDPGVQGPVVARRRRRRPTASRMRPSACLSKSSAHRGRSNRSGSRLRVDRRCAFSHRATKAANRSSPGQVRLEEAEAQRGVTPPKPVRTVSRAAARGRCGCHVRRRRHRASPTHAARAEDGDRPSSTQRTGPARTHRAIDGVDIEVAPFSSGLDRRRTCSASIRPPATTSACTGACRSGSKGAFDRENASPW
jgi:hypothetical protein